MILFNWSVFCVRVRMRCSSIYLLEFSGRYGVCTRPYTGSIVNVREGMKIIQHNRFTVNNREQPLHRDLKYRVN